MSSRKRTCLQCDKPIVDKHYGDLCSEKCYCAFFSEYSFSPEPEESNELEFDFWS